MMRLVMNVIERIALIRQSRKKMESADYADYADQEQMPDVA